MDESIRFRFQAVIDASQVNYKAASLRAGRGATYVRDAIKRNRGKLEDILSVVDVIAPKYREWVQSGQGDPPPHDLNLQYPGENGTESSFKVVGIVDDNGNVVFEDSVYQMKENEGDTEELLALQVQGYALGVGFNGWHVIFRQRRVQLWKYDHRLLWIVCTRDGRLVVRWLRKPKGAKPQMISGLGVVEEDIEFKWVAEVLQLRGP